MKGEANMSEATQKETCKVCGEHLTDSHLIGIRNVQVCRTAKPKSTGTANMNEKDKLEEISDAQFPGWRERHEVDAYGERCVHTPPGTAWTAPGQGADASALWDAIGVYRERFAAECGGDQHKDPDTYDADKRLEFFGLKGENPRTNLRLTGSPLTADDLKRIAECEVAK
jgi:hypothetical protein